MNDKNGGWAMFGQVMMVLLVLGGFGWGGVFAYGEIYTAGANSRQLEVQKLQAAVVDTQRSNALLLKAMMAEAESAHKLQSYNAVCIQANGIRPSELNERCDGIMANRIPDGFVIAEK